MDKRTVKKIFLGGPFQFHYKDYTDEHLSEDYRAEIIGMERFKRKPIEGQHLMLSKTTEYIGPFYFYEQPNDAVIVVRKESAFIENCTDAFFLIGINDMPGTITEMVYAALRHANVFIYYVREQIDTGEVGRTFLTSQWYPLTFISIQNISKVEIYGFDSYEEAKTAIIKRIREYV